MDTLKPLASHYGISINQDCVRDETDKLVGLLKKLSTQKKAVVVSWQHEKLHEIAVKLGVEPGTPDKSEYDYIWQVSVSANGAAKLTKTSQNCGSGQ